MILNDAGINLIKTWEACWLQAYPDPGSPLGRELTKRHLENYEYKLISNWQELDGTPWTIGYGSTLGVNEGMLIDKSEAEKRLMRDIAAIEPPLRRLLKVNLTPNQYSALVSFCFNCGFTKEVKDSTLLKLINKGKTREAAEEFPRWNKSNGVPMRGLTRRRFAERALFLKA
jgi:lysozyme